MKLTTIQSSTRSVVGKTIGLLSLAMPMMLLWGCASSTVSTSDKRTGLPPSQTVSPGARDQALEHFINGSLYEAKGDPANAVLEYLDALRYEKNHAIFFALAKNYSALRKYALAIDAAQEAIHRAPTKKEYLRVLAENYAAAFQIDSAITAYERLIRLDPTAIDAWYNLARLYQAGKPSKALDAYETIISRFGPQWDALIQMVELYNANGQFDKAAGALKQMLGIDPGNVELKKSLAQAYMRAQQYDEAMIVYGDLRAQDPGDIEYLGNIATIHLLRKEYDKAAVLFEGILSRDSVDVETKLRIGEVYFSQLQKDSTLIPVVLRVFEHIRDSYPEDWRPYWYLGAVGAVGHIDSIAVPNLRKVTELASWNADAWVYLSSVFMEKNDYQEVATVLESALKVVPEEFQVNLYLGVAYNRLGRNEEAVAVLQKARRLNPKDINALSQLAIVFDGMKKHEDADRLYEEGLRMDPANALLLNNYGYSLADRGIELERALEMAKRAIDAQPDNASFLDTMGWVYYRLGKYKQAETFIKRAISKGEVSAVVYEHLGDIYFKLDDREGALEQWGNALKLDANNTALQEKINRGTL